MINKERVRQMTKMAVYEEDEGKKYIPMTQYFRHDYIGKELVKSIISGTIAFALLIVVYVSCQMNYFMDHINQIDILTLGKDSLFQYLVFMAAYLAVTYVVYSMRYTEGRRHVKQFYNHLRRVNKIYEQEENGKQNDDWE